MRKRRSLRDRYWPKVTDVTSAREVAHRAASVAIIIAGFTAVFAGLALFGIPMVPGVDHWAFIDAAIWGGVAAGIWRMSRGAAIAGLVVIVLEYVLFWDREVGVAHLIATVVLLLAFLNALRATYAYHRFRRTKVEALSPAPLEPR
jgi:hypothetical protein